MCLDKNILDLRITYEQIREPDEKDRDKAEFLIEVDGEEGEGQDSQTDGVDEEGSVAGRQVDVVLERLQAVHLSDVDVEDVDHEGALDHVEGSEEDRGGGDVEVDGVPLAVRNGVGVEALVPGQWQDVLHHEIECRHHLYRSSNTASDAVSHPSENLQPGDLHVVAGVGDGHVDEPEVDQVAQGGYKGIEEQTETDHTDKLVPSFLKVEYFYKVIYDVITSVLLYVLCTTFLMYLSTSFPKPKNWCLKYHVKQ